MSKCIYQLRVALFFFIGLSIFSFALPLRVRAGSIPEASSPKTECQGTLDAWRSSGDPRSLDCRCDNNGQLVCGQSTAGGSVSGGNYNFDQEIKTQVVETIFQGLLTSLFSDNTASQKQALEARQKAAALAARQASALQKEKDREAQAAYEKMMRSYKQLDDDQGVAFKTLSDSALTFKTLDSDDETLAANARSKPFDTPSETPGSGKMSVGGATPFFGDTMPTKDIRLLVNPENDPDVVDLRNAVTYVVKNIKNGPNPSAKAQAGPAGQAKGGPIIQAPDCAQLTERLNGYLDQRAKFQKTIDLAQGQLNVWETANRNALLNAAKDGLEYFTGQLFDVLAKRAEAAARLERIYQKNARQMAREGLDVADIQAKIKRLKALSSLNRISELRSKMGEIDAWRSFLKDGLSALINQLTASNQEIQEMLADPRMQKYFETEAPELKTLLDISTIAASYKVFGKWVAKKLPIIGGVQLAINEAYNGLDWFLSYKRLAEANQINGHVMASARYIQQNIDDTSLALRECH